VIIRRFQIVVVAVLGHCFDLMFEVTVTVEDVSIQYFFLIKFVSFVSNHQWFPKNINAISMSTAILDIFLL